MHTIMHTLWWHTDRELPFSCENMHCLLQQRCEEVNHPTFDSCTSSHDQHHRWSKVGMDLRPLKLSLWRSVKTKKIMMFCLWINWEYSTWLTPEKHLQSHYPSMSCGNKWKRIILVCSPSFVTAIHVDNNSIECVNTQGNRKVHC